jgi:hypothetical protein
MATQILVFGLIALAVGMAVAWLVYRKVLGIRRAYWVAAGLRALIVAGVLLLLFNPSWNVQQVQVILPRVFIGLDRSQSMVAHADSAALESAFRSSIAEAQSRWKDRAEVQPFWWGESAHLEVGRGFQEPMTRLDEPLLSTLSGTDGRAAGAILITDGIAHRGLALEFLPPTMPIQWVGVGDTTQRPDLSIGSVVMNQTALANKSIPLEITLLSNDLPSQNAILRVVDADGNNWIREEVALPAGTNRVVRKLLRLPAQPAGQYPIRVLVETGLDEPKGNNSRFLNLEVVESATRVWLLSNAPHPEIGLMRRTLARLPQFEVQSAVFDAQPAPWQAGDILVVIPTATEVPATVRNHRGPQLWMVAQSNGFSLWDDAVQWKPLIRNSEFITPQWKQGHWLNWSAPAAWELPPLSGQAGTLTGRGVSTVADISIQGVASQAPLLALVNDPHHGALFFGQGLWRWAMHDQRDQQGEATLQLLQAIMGFLEAEPEEEIIQLEVNPQYAEGEVVQGKLRVQRPGGGLWVGATVQLELQGAGQSHRQTVVQESDDQIFKLKELPEGVYRLRAVLAAESKVYSQTVGFEVTQQSLERSDVRARIPEMRAQAIQNNGGVYALAEWESALEAVEQTLPPGRRQVFVQQVNLREQGWWAIAVLVLMAGEWFLRKWTGKL